ncbi:MAG: hypothetical protein WBL44_18395 [Nitrososphaeraceae archaeon]
MKFDSTGKLTVDQDEITIVLKSRPKGNKVNLELIKKLAAYFGLPTTWVHIFLAPLDVLLEYSVMNNGQDKRWSNHTFHNGETYLQSSAIYDRVPNSENSRLMTDFHSCMKNNTTSK